MSIYNHSCNKFLCPMIILFIPTGWIENFRFMELNFLIREMVYTKLWQIYSAEISFQRKKEKNFFKKLSATNGEVILWTFSKCLPPDDWFIIECCSKVNLFTLYPTQRIPIVRYGCSYDYRHSKQVCSKIIRDSNII